MNSSIIKKYYHREKDDGWYDVVCNAQRGWLHCCGRMWTLYSTHYIDRCILLRSLYVTKQKPQKWWTVDKLWEIASDPAYSTTHQKQRGRREPLRSFEVFAVKSKRPGFGIHCCSSARLHCDEMSRNLNSCRLTAKVASYRLRLDCSLTSYSYVYVARIMTLSQQAGVSWIYQSLHLCSEFVTSSGTLTSS